MPPEVPSGAQKKKKKKKKTDRLVIAEKWIITLTNDSLNFSQILLDIF